MHSPPALSGEGSPQKGQNVEEFASSQTEIELPSLKTFHSTATGKRHNALSAAAGWKLICA